MKINKYLIAHRLLPVTLLTAVVFLTAHTLHAQQAEIVTYMKNSGHVVADKDSADYIRIIRAPERGQKLYTLQEYYRNGNLKRTGQVTAPSLIPHFEGKTTTYYEDGGKEAVSHYIKNRPNGQTERYYRNGQLKEQIHYATDTAGRPGAEPVIYVNSLYDSLGTAMVTGGNGYARYPSDNGRDTEEGNFAGGVKNGVWKGYFQGQRYTFEEIYEHGKLISGSSKDSSGNAFTYARVFVGPEFPGGMKEFYTRVARNYRYPKEAIRQRVNGELHIKFVIDTTGKADSVQVISDLGYGTGEEATRVLEHMADRWHPGKERGVPVRVSHTLPIRLRVRPGTPPVARQKSAPSIL